MTMGSGYNIVNLVTTLTRSKETWYRKYRNVSHHYIWTCITTTEVIMKLKLS